MPSPNAADAADFDILLIATMDSSTQRCISTWGWLLREGAKEVDERPFALA